MADLPPGSSVTLTVGTGSPVVLSATVPTMLPVNSSTSSSLQEYAVRPMSNSPAVNMGNTFFIAYILKLYLAQQDIGPDSLAAYGGHGFTVCIVSFFLYRDSILTGIEFIEDERAVPVGL